jgi:hypothetical protein
MSDLLNSASLVLIPSGYKEDTVYSVVPSDGSGDLSFTRASNGTRINSAGLVEVCPWNYKSYSEDLTVGSGLQGSDITTITANTTETTDPFGTNKAEKFDGSSGQLADTYNAIPENSVITSSIYAKAGSVSTFILRLNASFGTIAQATFNLSSGTITATSGDVYLNSTITPIGNGWYRCSITYNFISVPTNRILLNANGSLYFFGWQLNIGSTAKPYFPTTDRLNVPRLTYQNGGGGCPSLLLEKQSTNLVAYSDDFSNAWWNKYTASITTNQVTSPDGTQNADKVLADSGTYGVIYTNQIFTVGQVITSSCYMKQGDGTLVNFGYTDNGADYYARFDVANGTIVTTSGVTASIQNAGNGWFRCIITRTMAGNANLYIQLSDAGKYVYCWGAQSEVSSYATSLINTNGASATRVADACFKTGISSLIGQTEGVVFLDWIMLRESLGVTEDYYTITLNNGTGNTLFAINNYDNRVRFYYFISGSLIFSNTSFEATSGQRLKMAFAYKQNDFAVYINGNQIATSSSGNVAGMSGLTIGCYVFQNYNDNIQVNQAALFKTRLSNSELASLTTL